MTTRMTDPIRGAEAAATASSQSCIGRLNAVVVTYRRPDGLARCLRSLAEQTHGVDSVIIVDNDASGGLRPGSPADAWASMPFQVHVLIPGRNLGPAGGFAFGIDFLLGCGAADQWVVLVDDDDPLPIPTMLESLVRRRNTLIAAGVHLGGIGAKGARFDTLAARTRPVPATRSDLYEVDHLHGGYAPIYRIAALQEIGNFRAELFWGFEELDVGLRLNDAGWRLFVDVDVLRALPPTAKLTHRTRPRLLVHGDESFERRYYKERNLAFIARERSPAIGLRASLALREVAKPLLSLPVRPRLAWSMLRWNLRARRDAAQGVLGRTVLW